jgi:hypothetical protein
MRNVATAAAAAAITGMGPGGQMLDPMMKCARLACRPARGQIAAPACTSETQPRDAVCSWLSRLSSSVPSAEPSDHTTTAPARRMTSLCQAGRCYGRGVGRGRAYALALGGPGRGSAEARSGGDGLGLAGVPFGARSARPGVSAAVSEARVS